MKKIAIIVNTLLSGGSEKQSIYLYNALQSQYETYLIVIHGHRIENKLLKSIEGKNENIIKLKGCLLIRILAILKFLSNNNINYVFTYLTFPNTIGALTASLAGVNNIYGGLRSSYLPIWKMLIERFIQNNLATGVIINNYSGEKIFKKLGFKNTVVIPNCYVNISKSTDRDSIDIIKIVTVGRFVKEKDFHTSIKSIIELRKMGLEFIYTIVGYGELEQQIRNDIQKYQLDNFINILVNPPNIIEILINSNIYLSTSIFEGTSNSIMEAMNVSLPIVATRVGDNDQLVIHGESGFLNRIGDYKGIAENLFILATNDKLRNQFGRKSNLILQKKYSFEKFKYEYIKLIEHQ